MSVALRLRPTDVRRDSVISQSEVENLGQAGPALGSQCSECLRQILTVVILSVSVTQFIYSGQSACERAGPHGKEG